MFSYIRLFVTTLLFLLALTFGEKALFAFYHRELWDELAQAGYALLWGIKFDLAISTFLALLCFAIAYLAQRLLRLPVKTSLRWLSLIAAMALIGLQGADMLYYNEAGRHLGYELKEGLNSGFALAKTAAFTYTGPVVLQLLLIVGVFFANRRLYRSPLADTRDYLIFTPRSKPFWFWLEATLLVALIASAVIIRGGLQSVPLEPLHAQEIGNSRQATLALNGAYNALFSSITPYSVNPLFDSEPDAAAIATVKGLYHDTPRPPGLPRTDANIVVILLESWSAAYMGSYGYAVDSTPYFDSLRRAGLTTSGMLAGGHRTTEGMFSTLCSAQNPLGGTIAQSQLQNYDYRCLPNILREHGWSTAFFQGTNKNTSGTGVFAQLLGFEESYGKEDMDPDSARYEPNSWGFHDPDVYDFALEKIRAMPRPFLVGINTNSTHDSWLPPGVEALLPGKEHKSRYISTLHFADQALHEFIDRFRNDPELADTIFVILADHTGLTPPDPFLHYLIPFVIYAPDQVAAIEISDITSQRDVAPTVLDLLNLPVPRQYTGLSMLAPGDTSFFADFYHQGLFGWSEDGRVVTFHPDKPDTMRCLSTGDKPANPKAITCVESEREMMVRANAFNHLNQSLLFSGKLPEFGNIRH